MARTYSVAVDEPDYTGEGITYTTDKRARLYAVVVPFEGRQPMRCTIRATSQQQAMSFAVARHPGAIADRIRVLSKAEAGGLL